MSVCVCVCLLTWVCVWLCVDTWAASGTAATGANWRENPSDSQQLLGTTRPQHGARVVQTSLSLLSTPHQHPHTYTHLPSSQPPTPLPTHTRTLRGPQSRQLGLIVESLSAVKISLLTTSSSSSSNWPMKDRREGGRERERERVVGDAATMPILHDATSLC